ncbi:MAG: NAD(P)/FAD-dependent oxidoreductase [Tepidisphaerales bacterium]
MLRDGQKGVVLQRDGKSYAVAPHLPCGLVTAAMLRRLADAADKYGATLKVTSAERIALVGVKPEDVDAIWADLGGKPGFMVGNRVRSVKACPGTHFCKRARQDSLTVGLELDKRYIARELPGKMKMGVSGCANQCAETAIKDIGLVGGAHGWLVMVGGNGGTCPRLAKTLVDEEVSTERALELVEQIVQFYEKHAQPQERLGETINRLGMPDVKKALGLL